MKSLFITMILATTLTGGSIYDFKIAGLDGTDIDFSQYKGKKIMIVNTASKCGNTPQFAELEKLYEKYKDKLVIVGVPANNFGGQEPGTEADVKAFCTSTYGVATSHSKTTQARQTLRLRVLPPSPHRGRGAPVGSPLGRPAQGFFVAGLARCPRRGRSARLSVDPVL